MDMKIKDSLRAKAKIQMRESAWVRLKNHVRTYIRRYYDQDSRCWREVEPFLEVYLRTSRGLNRFRIMYRISISRSHRKQNDERTT